MNQQPLDLHPVSHRNDPATSKDAERKVTDSGKRKSNNEKVAWLVSRWPGLTPSEYAVHAFNEYGLQLGDTPDKRIFEVRRRLSDMNGIHVRRGTKDEARLGLLANKESVWYPR